MRVDRGSFALSIVGTGRARGQIAITCCPGRAGGLPLPSSSARLLERDVDTIRRWGAQAMVTLLDDLEMARLRAKALPELLASRGIIWHHLPLDSRCVPDPAFEEGWQRLAPVLLAMLREGGRLAVHCRDGQTRASMVAVRLLVEAGCAPYDAINRVRAARPGALENVTQEHYVCCQRHAMNPAQQLSLLDGDTPEMDELDAEAEAVYSTARGISAVR